MQLASILRPLLVCVAMAASIEVAPAVAQMRPSGNLAMATATVNVRQGAGTRYPVVDILHRGEEVEVIRCRNNFCLIVHEGPQGWVSERYLKRLVVQPR
ncbi:SH3 domain-containing protein [Youhaiella tibetensis]|uniref:SH3 domain-containing protein n=1 Tax=Paradevosia tibetensis TaxID=1447062 RepID=A0A5B9DSD9_9HYPH|nr:SH3 domain-containing protein [Youhaiella tibetensis]QEE22083.1 SH3 domain-containing protein [Youhaiella tibetensis]